MNERAIAVLDVWLHDHHVGSITNIVNGYVVNVGTKSSLTEGKILFQSEGAEIFFRKIEVHPLVR